MKPRQLSRMTALGLISLSLFTLLFVSSILLQGASSALAAPHGPSLSSHSQAHSTTRPGGKSPSQGGGLICESMTGGTYIWSSAAVATVTIGGMPTSVVYIGSTDHYLYALKASDCSL